MNLYLWYHEKDKWKVIGATSEEEARNELQRLGPIPELENQPPYVLDQPFSFEMYTDSILQLCITGLARKFEADSHLFISEEISLNKEDLDYLGTINVRKIGDISRLGEIAIKSRRATKILVKVLETYNLPKTTIPSQFSLVDESQ